VRLQPLRRLPHLLVLGGLPLCGCAQFGPSATVTAPAAVARAPSADAVVQASTAAVTGTEPAAEAPKALPINLDTVFRLAEGQNAQMGRARARVQGAVRKKNAAAGRWLPNVWVGVTYARHEGGIQDFNGNLVHSSYGSLWSGLEVCGKYDLREIVYQRINAERQLWQQQGEVSRVTSH